MNVPIVVLVVALAGCGAGGKDVEVKGNDNELAKIAGDWQGTYKGVDSGRSGPVRFSLQLGRHVAEGEVVMDSTTPLKIEFVQIKSGQIKGTIAPYTDPSCACQVETSFLGTIAGDAISGTFETKIAAKHLTQTGAWEAARKAR